MTFSIGKKAPFSALLYAEAFGLGVAEAESDLSVLFRGGALPLSLSAEGKVLSEGIGIPLWEGGATPVLYLYALATDPPSRGQGLLRTLIRESALWAGAQGYAALCLLPADAGLSSAYRRMGFTEERPAGGAAVLAEAEDLSLFLDGTVPPIPCPPDEVYASLGSALSQSLFFYALSSLGDGVGAFRIGAEHAILFKKDPRYALAVSAGLASLAGRRAPHCYLLMPLAGPLPQAIPEPLPR